MKKKKTLASVFSFVCLILQLRFGNRANGATVLASTAVDARVGINNIFAVAFCNCANGAGVCARSARNALVTYNSCHSFSPFKMIDIIIAHRFRFVQ